MSSQLQGVRGNSRLQVEMDTILPQPVLKYALTIFQRHLGVAPVSRRKRLCDAADGNAGLHGLEQQRITERRAINLRTGMQLRQCVCLNGNWQTNIVVGEEQRQIEFRTQVRYLVITEAMIHIKDADIGPACRFAL
ncbi:hypothetical protein WL93_20925 [Burkholderia diffusa]|nr:hypothetical protein WL93_20925 [Burkholderia diffusa]